MKTFRSVLLLFTVISFASCINNSMQELKTSQKATNFNDLVAPPEHTWTTGDTVRVIIEGLPTTIPVSNTLYLTNTNQLTDTIYKGFHLMSENLSFRTPVPAGITSMSLKFGSINLTSAIVNKTVNFSFIPTAE